MMFHTIFWISWIFFICLKAEVVIAGEQPITDVEFRRAEELLKETSSSEFNIREKATQDLRHLFNPITRERVDAWEAWIQNAIPRTLDAESRNRIRTLSPLTYFSIGINGNSQVWSGFGYKQDGRWILHRRVSGGPPGKEICVMNFHHGVLSGNVELYDDHGRIAQSCEYKLGKKHGQFRAHYLNNSNSLYWQGEYSKGLKDGKWVQYSLDGNEFCRFELKNGSGEELECSEQGKIILKAVRVDGHRNGRFQRWDPDGKLCLDGNFKYIQEFNMSVPDGEWKTNSINIESFKRSSESSIFYFQRGLPWNGRVHTWNGRSKECLEFKDGFLFRGEGFQEGAQQGTLSPVKEIDELFNVVEFNDQVHIKAKDGHLNYFKIIDLDVLIANDMPTVDESYFEMQIRELLARLSEIE